MSAVAKVIPFRRPEDEPVNVHRAHRSVEGDLVQMHGVTDPGEVWDMAIRAADIINKHDRKRTRQQKRKPNRRFPFPMLYDIVKSLYKAYYFDGGKRPTKDAVLDMAPDGTSERSIDRACEDAGTTWSDLKVEVEQEVLSSR